MAGMSKSAQTWVADFERDVINAIDGVGKSQRDEMKKSFRAGMIAMFYLLQHTSDDEAAAEAEIAAVAAQVQEWERRLTRDASAGPDGRAQRGES